MSSTPKFFTDAMTGAPVLSGTAGALIAILDACLVNGFGLKTADSVTVAGGIATMNFSTGHSFEANAIALVAGATPAGLNGEQRILSVTTNTASYATTAPDGTATGTITAKLAPLGWTKVYSGTNKAVYKPSAVEASSAMLRVDDTGTNYARIRMFEAMTDVDTGVNPAPNDVNVPGGAYWCKSSSANSAAKSWTMFGDDRNFYFAPAFYSTSTNKNACIYAFGDLASYKSGDAFCGFVTGDVNDLYYSTLDGNAAGSSSMRGSTQVVRSHSGMGVAINCERRPMTGSAGGLSGGDLYLGRFPAAVNNGLFLSRIIVSEMPASTNGPRGYLPGVLYVPQAETGGGKFRRGTIVDGTGEFFGRKIYAVPQSSNSISVDTNDYAAFFDLTGPWRD